MRTTRTGWILGALALLGLAASCDSSDHLILLTLHANEPVSEVQVFTTSLDDRTRARYAHPSQVVPIEERDFAATPGRISIHVGGPASVMVHVVAQAADGDVLVATRCYDLAVQGVIEDALVLVGPLGSLDADADGFPASPADACQEPDADAGGAPRVCAAGDAYLCADSILADCEDANDRIYPGASFPNTCQDDVDDDCDGDIEETCADLDGDDFNACPPTPIPNCDCDDTSGSISPGAAEVCEDAVDQDCDGADDFCDRDLDGYPSDVDCDDDNDAVFPGASEAPIEGECDGVDNNCNELVDEDPGCLGPDLDGDGVRYCPPGTVDTSACDCNDCDAGVHGANEDGSVLGRELCGPRVDPLLPGNGIDDDCDGMMDEGCVAEDMDGDGQVPPSDCDDTDPLAYPQLGGEWLERCGDGVNQNCVPGGESMVCPAGDTDGDGFAEPGVCEDDIAINPTVAESCNLVDDDCDGTTDEILVIGSPTGCTREPDGSARSVNYATSFLHCGGCRLSCDAQTANVCNDNACDCSTEDDYPGVCVTDAPGGRPTCCPSGCEDTANDVLNCGGCGLACGAGESCVDGQCTCGTTVGAGAGGHACPDPGTEDSVCCAGSCRDVVDDPLNCGFCDFRCGSNSFCTNRFCQCDPAGTQEWADCDMDRATNPRNSGCEIDIRSNVDHCAGCGQACRPPNATGTCNGGDCQVETCAANYANCNLSHTDGCEAHLPSDPSNCNACGTVCNLANTNVHACVGGVCQVGTCDLGYADCDGIDSNGCEIDLDDPAHCGACGNDCGTNASCMDRACVCNAQRLDCTAGEPYCEVGFSVSDCGRCGATCGPRESCNGGGSCVCDGSAGGAGAGARCTGTNVECCPGSGCQSLRGQAHCGACDAGCGGDEDCNASGQCGCGGNRGGAGTGEHCDGSTPDCCGTGCTNRQTDSNNCGTCGMSCTTSTQTNRCSGGSCVCGGGPACASGRTCCGAAPGGTCFDLMTDEAHCGSCTNVCGSNQECVSGSCVCAPGFVPCGSGGACISESSMNCGPSCTDCPGNQICDFDADTCGCGGATRWCPSISLCELPGDESCGSSCVDCTATGRTCSGTGGSAVCQCASGSRFCASSNSCQVASIDSCGTSCDDCNQGAGEECCGGFMTGMCIDTDGGNPNHCGACGAQCGTGEGCNSSGRCTCGSTTATGSAGSGTDACAAGETCVSGSCTGG